MGKGFLAVGMVWARVMGRGCHPKAWTVAGGRREPVSGQGTGMDGDLKKVT